MDTTTLILIAIVAVALGWPVLTWGAKQAKSFAVSAWEKRKALGSPRTAIAILAGVVLAGKLILPHVDLGSAGLILSPDQRVGREIAVLYAGFASEVLAEAASMDDPARMDQVIADRSQEIGVLAFKPLVERLHEIKEADPEDVEKQQAFLRAAAKGVRSVE